MSAYSSDSETTVAELNGCEAPKVVFKCRPHSHPFNERHVVVADTVKIGRSVAKSKPADTNAIFDCKVLSRNHAVMWYEDNCFWLKDTKSSNGTFVNSQRLGKGNEESPPRSVFSGDIIQFGVDVMENSKKVTHGCIIAQVTLYHADGQEAKKPTAGQSQLPGVASSTAESVSQEQVYQLSQYLQEALHREQLIADKFDKFKEVLEAVGAMNETSWSAVLNEERLLSRLELLENQLALLRSGPQREDVSEYLEEAVAKKTEAEEALKAKLEQYLAEKSAACHRLGQLERSYQECQEECEHLRDTCDKAKEQLQQLSAQYDKDTAGLKEELAGMQKENQSLVLHVKDLGEALVDKNFSELDANSLTVGVQTDQLPDSQSELRTQLKVYKDLLREQQEAQDISSKNVDNLHKQLESALAQIRELECRLTGAANDNEGSLSSSSSSSSSSSDKDRPDSAWLLTLLRSLAADAESVARAERLLSSASLPGNVRPSNGAQTPPDGDADSLREENAALKASLADMEQLRARLLAEVANQSQLLAGYQQQQQQQDEQQEQEQQEQQQQQELRRRLPEASVAVVQTEASSGDSECERLRLQYRQLQEASSGELAACRRQLQTLSDRSRLISAAALLPLFALLFSVTVSLYMWLTGQS